MKDPFSNRVKETTTSNGTTTMTLAGAVSGFKTFASKYAVGVKFPYLIETEDQSVWEVGIGKMNDSTTLDRLEVLESTNSDTLVNFTSGMKTVSQPLPAQLVNQMYKMSLDALDEAYLKEDLLSGASTANASGSSFTAASALPIVYLVSGASTSQTGLVEDGAPGVIDLSTSTSATGAARLWPWCKPNVILGAGELRVRWRFKVVGPASDATNRYAMAMGLRDVISGTGNGIFLQCIDNVNGGNWTVDTTVAGTTTVNNTSITPAYGSWTVVEMVVNEDNSGISFYVDGVLALTVTDDLPTVMVGVIIQLNKTVGTSARRIMVDYVDFRLSLTTPRLP